MSKPTAAKRLGKRAAARIRSIRRRAAAWRLRARRALTLATLTAGMSLAPSFAEAQMGQSAMAPTGGLVNRAVQGFKNLDANGPGYLYYGVNAADRGLGYQGSYMTLGGFVPFAEDDLGGFWSADLRGHLSEYGGFFSNVGAVRKQFLGGTLLGVGIYWDYDGDLNQYPTRGALGTAQFGQFGHTYNQVGVSGEWLTDYGNFRSNGYIPVGTTAYTAGAPNFPFYQNFVMCRNGLDAALGGADLEVGAYIPALADWSGMISVGGYALGNVRYDWWQGPSSGQGVVPWFGGVYTRLDMTFLKNWDFSLQANNDSYFDWTGFARLTYRMGGSRRRNVPDQMEQPMMRNEHIVRAHQTPIVALNADNGNQPWRVVHIDNSAPAGGDGTVERPYNTLAAADTPSAAGGLAGNPWTIFFVDRGDGTATGYDTQFSFLNQNQYLIGNGTQFLLPTVNCGLDNIASDTSGQRPLLSNPAGTSVFIDGATAGGATVANFQITGSNIGIKATGNLTGLPSTAFPGGKPTEVHNVIIASDGTQAGQSGVIVKDASGAIAFTDTQIANMTTVGFEVDGNGPVGGPQVDYQGGITNVVPQGSSAGPLVNITNTDGATVNLAVGSAPAGSTVPNQISDNGGQGIRLSKNTNASAINIDNVSLTNNAQAAIGVINDNATTVITAGAGSGIQKTTAGAAITVEGGAPTFTYSGPITNARPAAAGPSSFLLNVSDIAGGSVTLLSPPGSPFIDTGDGIQIIGNSGGSVLVQGAQITSAGAQGILINNNSGGDFAFNNLTIDSASSAGVLINDSPTSATTFSNLNITLANSTAIGFQANNSGPITSTDTNTITAAATTLPAVQIIDSGPLDLTFSTVSSAVAPGTNAAMIFGGSSNGTFNVTSLFSVSGTKGTVAADVTGDAPPVMTVTVPP
ncbi:MAG: hypothetical protein ACKOSQ_10420 [Planctomycetaceae bacterium]